MEKNKGKRKKRKTNGSEHKEKGIKGKRMKKNEKS